MRCRSLISVIDSGSAGGCDRLGRLGWTRNIFGHAGVSAARFGLDDPGTRIGTHRLRQIFLSFRRSAALISRPRKDVLVKITFEGASHDLVSSSL